MHTSSTPRALDEYQKTAYVFYYYFLFIFVIACFTCLLDKHVTLRCIVQCIYIPAVEWI